MRRGDVVLIAFPFTEASDVKLRPAVVVSADDLPTGPDVVVLPISSRLDGGDPHVVRVGAADLRATGLKKPSVVKWSKPATLHRRLLRRRLGEMPNALLGEIDAGLRTLFGLT